MSFINVRSVIIVFDMLNDFLVNVLSFIKIIFDLSIELFGGGL